MVYCLTVAKDYVSERRLMAEQMSTFSIRDAECFDEADRRRVEKNIKAWFGDEDDDALDAFDRYVRTQVREAMEGLIGSSSGAVPYSFCVLANWVNLMSDVGMWSPTLATEITPAAYVDNMWGAFSCIISTGPVTVLGLLTVARVGWLSPWLGAVVLYALLF